jgi:hypothetical protein
MASRAEMQCRSNGLAPQALYSLAKRRGMGFVTIADRDSIEAVLEIADWPDVVHLRGAHGALARQAAPVHVLCHGLSVHDHRWLQRRAADLEVCAAYLREHSIACTLAEDEPRPRRLAELFPQARPGVTETPHADTPWEFLAHVRRGWATTRAVPEAPLVLAA